LEVWVAVGKLDTFIAKVEDLSSGTAKVDTGEQGFVPNNLRLKHPYSKLKGE